METSQFGRKIIIGGVGAWGELLKGFYCVSLREIFIGQLKINKCVRSFLSKTVSTLLLCVRTVKS
jgi:hypothetical protein